MLIKNSPIFQQKKAFYTFTGPAPPNPLHPQAQSMPTYVYI